MKVYCLSENVRSNIIQEYNRDIVVMRLQATSLVSFFSSQFSCSLGGCLSRCYNVSLSNDMDDKAT